MRHADPAFPRQLHILNGFVDPIRHGRDGLGRHCIKLSVRTQGTLTGTLALQQGKQNGQPSRLHHAVIYFEYVKPAVEKPDERRCWII